MARKPKWERREEMREKRFSGNEIAWSFWAGVTGTAYTIGMIYLGFNSHILSGDIPIIFFIAVWAAATIGHMALAISARDALEKVSKVLARLLEWLPLIMTGAAVLIDYLT